MSAYSTLRISRSTAVKKMLGHIIDKITNEELERYLDELLEHRLYRTVIVPDGCENDDAFL